jgi:hypothetical protein
MTLGHHNCRRRVPSGGEDIPANLSYPPDVRHPPFLTLRGSLLPNHQKRNQDGDK